MAISLSAERRPSVLDILFLDSDRCPKKSRQFLYKLYQSAKTARVDCTFEKSYRDCGALVVYGLGGADRFSVGMEHISMGKPLLSFDIGYWDRKLPNRKYRFSLNGLHPTQVMDGRYLGADRWFKSGLSISSIKVRRDGPILLIGNAPKSIAVGADGWTAKKSRELREVFPGKKILYRPKPKRPHEVGVIHDGLSHKPIDDAMKKVSLVVSRHSNVAVDACRIGVPVVCDDGAAACIYPEHLSDYKSQPTLEYRTEFLHRLAYWQWAAHEVDLFWGWFFGAFPEHDHR